MKHEAVRLAEVSLDFSGPEHRKASSYLNSDCDGRPPQVTLASQKNGSRKDAETVKALEAAQRAGVTHSEYLRAFILVERGLSPPDWLDDAAAIEQC